MPSVPLSEQHKRGFVEAGFEDRQWYVQAYSSDRSLNERNWSRELATKSVLISTSQCVVNCLEAGAASFDQLDLLVLDETHRVSGATRQCLLVCTRSCF